MLCREMARRADILNKQLIDIAELVEAVQDPETQFPEIIQRLNSVNGLNIDAVHRVQDLSLILANYVEVLRAPPEEPKPTIVYDDPYETLDAEGTEEESQESRQQEAHNDPFEMVPERYRHLESVEEAEEENGQGE
jgi:hypothetical protein